MRQFLFDISSFFFPAYCPVCGIPMHISGLIICLKCEQGIPKTKYVDDPDNPVAQLFWGRVFIEGATSLFRFEKGSKYQSLLHLLKYKGAKEIGVFLGKLLGIELINTPFADVNFIVPVPLHIKKEKQRGYNQSVIIASGLTMITGIPVNDSVLFRKINTDSQTRKNRFERWENMESVFGLHDRTALPEKPAFLLIDDVVTTGSTLEACAAALLSIPEARVFIATVACA